MICLICVDLQNSCSNVAGILLGSLLASLGGNLSGGKVPERFREGSHFRKGSGKATEMFVFHRFYMFLLCSFNIPVIITWKIFMDFIQRFCFCE